MSVPEMALSPYRVLDLADEKAVLATRLMADLGADVIKIEPPGGDATRRRPPFVGDDPHPEKSLYWLYRNANKRGITLSLETSEGRGILHRLVENADILIESTRPGEGAALGLDFETLHAVNPELIHVSVTNFGPDGPYAGYETSEIVAWAMSGGMYSSGEPDREPLNAPGTLAYDSAAAYAASGAMLALYDRALTGEGQHVEVSLHEAALAALVPWSVSGYAFNVGHATNPGVRVRPRLGPSGISGYPCKDGYIALALLTPPAFRALYELLEYPEELVSPPWNEPTYILTHQGEFSLVVTKYLMNLTREEIFHRGQSLGLPCWPNNTPPEMFEDRHHRERGFWVEVDHPSHGPAEYAGAPWKLEATPAAIRRPAPLIGEHNLEIYAELGYGADEVSALRRAGTI